MEIHQAGIFDNNLLHSLNTIQAAKTQLRLLTMSGSTPTVLVSQIGLCDVLLAEIHAIRSSLERRLRPQDPVCGGAQHSRRGRPIVEQSSLAKSLETRKLVRAASDSPNRVSAPEGVASEP
jgi:hypothetical protein